MALALALAAGLSATLVARDGGTSEEESEKYARFQTRGNSVRNDSNRDSRGGNSGGNDSDRDSRGGNSGGNNNNNSNNNNNNNNDSRDRDRDNRDRDDDHGHDGDDDHKFEICHKDDDDDDDRRGGRTIEVSFRAIAAHQRHGDTLGRCPRSPRR
jgi:hypothetical protein